MGQNATSRKYRKLERHKKGGKGRLKPKPKREHKSWQTRDAARKPKQEAYMERETADRAAMTSGTGESV